MHAMNRTLEKLLTVCLGLLPVILITPVLQAVTEWSKGGSLVAALGFFFGVPLVITYGIRRIDAARADTLLGWFVALCLLLCLGVLVLGAVLPIFVA